jgi:citrate lyase subunit beta/citryl-CoA lyase
MSTTIRPRRSVLYMPGSNARALEKARTLPADALILDLEDAVAPEAKEAARSKVAASVRAGGYGHREVVVRINGADTPWFQEDIAAIAACGADAVLLPKVESAVTIEEAIRRLGQGGAPADLPLWIMAETPRGVLHLEQIISTHPRLAVIVMGTSDLAKEMRVSPAGDRAGLMHALGHCILAARAQGLDIIDGVHLALDDSEGFAAACRQGRELGFDGKTLIHPRQIETANDCFGVSAEAAANAREIVTAWQQARAAGDGITVVQGQLVEQLHVDEAERLLAIHQSTHEYE